MIESVKRFLRGIGAARTVTVAGKSKTMPRVPFRTIAQYNGLPVIYPDGNPCYDLPENAVLSCRGSMRVGENELAAYVYEGGIEDIERRRDRGWAGDTQ